MKNPFESSKKIAKNAFMATVATVAMLAPMESKAGNGGGGNKPSIETLKHEHLIHSVDAKQLKKIISDYESSPGASLDMFLDKYEGRSFMVTEAVGQTRIAAKYSAEQKMHAEGKVSMNAFTKDLGNGNVSVILVALEK